MTPNQSHIAELEQVIGLIDLVEHQPPVLDQARRILVKLVAMIEQAKAAPADPTEAVEVVATVTVSFDEGDEGSAIELCELHTLLDEGVTDLMTVAQHKRILAAQPQNKRNPHMTPNQLNRNTRDSVVSLLTQAGFSEDSSVINQLECMNFDAPAEPAQPQSDGELVAALEAQSTFWDARLAELGCLSSEACEVKALVDAALAKHRGDK